MGLADLLQLAGSARAYDLGAELFAGMPHFPSHPPFAFGLTKRHGEINTPMPDGRSSSASAELIATGTHVGTHLDGLGHFSCNGMLFGDIPAQASQTHTEGLSKYGMETVAPIVKRGVLLDIPAQFDVPVLDKTFTILPEHLEACCRRQNVTIGADDVVLIRTGWMRYWPDVANYLMGGGGNTPVAPGPGIDSARWLSARGIFATGADTIVYERTPSPFDVHVHLLVEKGIHIIEVLNLESLARDRVYEFLFIALPLKIRGATGSPIRPVALAL